MAGKNNKDVMKKIKIAMAKMGLNQTSLAKELGVKPNTISQWLTGTNSPKIETLQKISKVLGVPTNYFFENSSVGDGNKIINGNNNQMGEDKDMALILAKIATLESKIENLELKYNLLTKGK